MKHVNQLKIIIQSTKWSQEQLAAKLSVSFPTLNSWINEKSTPRAKALNSIKDLYFETIGSDSVSESDLRTAKDKALTLKMTAAQIVEDNELLNKLTLHLTYHTNTIEGSTMTLSDVEDVLFNQKVLSNRTAVEQVEARNHQATLHWLLDKVNFEGEKLTIDTDLILEIHLRLMNGILSDAGQFRKHAVRIMGANVALANWASVPSKLEKLMNTDFTVNESISSLALMHAQFEQIHPFNDGNGRTGRLLMLVCALMNGLTPPVVVRERKKAYYKYLEAAQTREQYEPLELFIAESIIFADELFNK
jgi:Fic family protein/DNA-binding XRE family transcriptional regulator